MKSAVKAAEAEVSLRIITPAWAKLLELVWLVTSATIDPSVLKEVEGFANGEYAAALSQGDDLPAAERKAELERKIAGL